MHLTLALVVCAGVAASACGRTQSDPAPNRTAPGLPPTAKTAVLESAANVVQSKGPVGKIALYLDGFHVAKDDPRMQMEAHHYCNLVNEEFTQCVLFDGNSDSARMTGIEYIISGRLYDTLPAREKAYWHPHNFEILSGQLRMPGVPDAAEKEALQGRINSYGKTWHTWMSGMFGSPSDDLPLGPARLQWSFNHDGEDAPGMIARRDARMGLDTRQARDDRADLAAMARAQGGVEAMRGQFPDAHATMPGVSDNGDASTHAIPTFAMKPPVSPVKP